jgi:hypothetical protein
MAQRARTGARGAYELVTRLDPADTVTTLLSSPAVLFNGHGFYSPKRGHTPSQRVYSTCEPMMPDPLMKGRLKYFMDCLQLEPDAQARILAFYLGCLIRPALSIMPGLLVRSPYKDTGKSTICKLAAMMVQDTPTPSVHSWKHEDELLKHLAAFAISGRMPLLVLDNVMCQDGAGLNSQVLASIVTSGVVEARVLGKNSCVDITNTMLAMTMQGGTISNDLVDRFLYAEITKPKPAVLKQDMLTFATNNFRQIRTELFTWLVETGRQYTDSWLPPNSFRYTEFARFVAPVVERFGLNPDHIFVREARSAQSDIQAVVKFLNKLCDGNDKWYSATDVFFQMQHDYATMKHLRCTIPEGFTNSGATNIVRGMLFEAPSILNYQRCQIRVERRKGSSGAMEYRATQTLEDADV